MKHRLLIPPSAVSLLALLVEIGKQKAQQECNNARNDYDRGGDTVHGVLRRPGAPTLVSDFERKLIAYVFIAQGMNTIGFKVSAPVLGLLKSYI